jgi:hypothetical protein
MASIKIFDPFFRRLRQVFQCHSICLHRSHLYFDVFEDAVTRDFGAELKALEDKTRKLKTRKVQQLGELVIATGADALTADELAGALIVLTETKEAGKR